MVLMIEEYLGRFSKSGPATCLRGSRLRRIKALRTMLMEFFESVDNLRIPLVDYEACVEAQQGKLGLRGRIEQALGFSHTTTL